MVVAQRKQVHLLGPYFPDPLNGNRTYVEPSFLMTICDLFRWKFWKKFWGSFHFVIDHADGLVGWKTSLASWASRMRIKLPSAFCNRWAFLKIFIYLWLQFHAKGLDSQERSWDCWRLARRVSEAAWLCNPRLFLSGPCIKTRLVNDLGATFSICKMERRNVWLSEGFPYLNYKKKNTGWFEGIKCFCFFFFLPCFCFLNKRRDDSFLFSSIADQIKSQQGLKIKQEKQWFGL